jgi:glycosyltransferase involved in cell wall biosynthesis
VERSDIAIIIPAYNEEKSIESVLNRIENFGDIIVVDDGSQDLTIEKVSKTSAIILKHRVNKGYESALSTGISYAYENRYRFFITIDADGELSGDAIQQVVEALKESVPLVLGIRSRKNRWIEYFFGSIAFVAYGLRDPLCGMKGYSADFFAKYKFFDTRKMIGTELVALAIRDSVEFKEVAVRVKKREGKSRFGGSLSSFFKISRVMWLFFSISCDRKI